MPVPLVNPLTVAVGSTVHITPIDQNDNPIPVDECTLQGAPGNTWNNAIATFVKDASGFVVTGVAPGIIQTVVVATAPGGGTSVSSSQFTVTVPWSVTAVGTTSP